MNPCNPPIFSKTDSQPGLPDIQGFQGEIVQVETDCIDLTDKGFQIRQDLSGQSFPLVSVEPLESLARSIRQLGLIRLPVLRLSSFPADHSQTSGKRYTVVAGFRRIQAITRILGQEKLWCRILPSAIESWECALLAVADNALTSSLLPGEIIRAVGLLGEFYPHEQIAGFSESLMGNSFHVSRIQELTAVAGMEDAWPDLLDAGKITLRSAILIASWKEDAQRNWYDMFSRIKVSSSKQTQMLTAFSEILAREKMDARTFFSHPHVRQIMELDTQDAGHKGEVFRQYLMARRYPSLEKEKARVKAHISELCLPKGIRLELPEHFESREYGISLKFTGHDQLIQKVDQLTRMISHPAWEGILSRQG